MHESPFTAREVYRQEWTGPTEPRVVQGALECLEELGWIRPEALRATDGGRGPPCWWQSPPASGGWCVTVSDPLEIGRSLDALRERYARGEISRDEFETMRRDLIA